MRKTAQRSHRISGFTLVEVMMAAVILTVGFVGLIDAVAISSNMMDQARRQTLASQILTHEIENLRLVDWATISSLPTASTTLGGAWDGSTGYLRGDPVTYNGSWYRCVVANSGQSPSNATFWRVSPPPYANALSTSGFAYGATYTLTRSISDVVNGSIREATFTVQWVVTTSRRDDSGNPVTFTYTRINAAYFGKYGLSLTYQRS